MNIETDEIRANPSWICLRTGDELTDQCHEQGCASDYYPVSTALALCDEVDRLRGHSVELNAIGWKLAEAVGDVGPDDTEVQTEPGDSEDRLVRLVAGRDAAFAALAQVWDLCDQTDSGHPQEIKAIHVSRIRAALKGVAS